MRKVILIMALVLALAPVAAAADTSVEGTLIDTRCYAKNHINTANDHHTPKGLMPGCAAACAKMGIPVAVLKEGKIGGSMVVLIAPAPPLADHMGKQVRIYGKEVSGNILPSKVEVKEKSGWKEIKVGTMM